MDFLKYLSPAYAAKGLLKPKNPADSALPHLAPIGPQSQEAFQPHINRGNQAAEATTGQYNQLAEDPYAYLDQAYEKYTPSKGYQFKKGLLDTELTNMAAANGYSSPFHEQRRAELTNSLLNSDFEDYWNKINGLRTQGLEGQQHYADQGYNANKELNDILANILQQKAGLAFQGQAQKNQYKSDLLKTIGQGVGGALGQGA